MQARNLPIEPAEPSRAAEVRSEETRRRTWILTIVATMTMAVSYVDRQAFAVLAPTITRVLGISDTAYGWLVSGFAIAYLVSAPIAGRFIERVGVRRGLVASVLTWSAIAAAHALAPGLGTLFALRILLGVAESPSFPAAAQTVSRALGPADRSLGFGILFSGSSFGSLIAPLLVTSLEARWGWRVALLGTAVVGLAWIPAWVAITRSEGVRRMLDSDGPEPTVSSTHWVHILRNPEVLRASTLIFVSAPILTFVYAWGSKMLVAMHGLHQSDLGRYLWFPPVLFDIGAIGFGVLATARARKRAVRGKTSLESAPPRLLVAVAALLASALMFLRATHSPWGTTLLFGITVAGAGGLYALATADAMGRLPRACIPVASGTVVAAQSLAQIVTNPIVGAVRDRTHSFATMATALGLCVLPGTIAWLLWMPRLASAASNATAANVAGGEDDASNERIQ